MCAQFPNVNRLVSREQFADIASMAVVEVAEVNLDTLRRAAYAMFDEKLDQIGSGMASVRQVISLLRFGYAEAAGTPVTLSKDLFDHSTLSRRRMAEVYDDTDGLPSPRRYLRTSRMGGSPRGSRSNLLEPLSSRPTASHHQRPRPITQGAELLNLPDHGPRPVTQGSSRGGTRGDAQQQLAQLSNEDDFIDDMTMRPPPGDDNYSSDEYDEEVERFTPWGQIDIVANSPHVAPVAPVALRADAPRPHTHNGVTVSASLPNLRQPSETAPVVGVEGTLRAVQARLFRRMPWDARLMLEHVDDGSRRSTTSKLAQGLRELASLSFPKITLPEEGLTKLMDKFDHLDNSSVDLREFVRCVGVGRIPSPGARQRARSPPQERKPRRKKKRAAASEAAIASAPAGAPVEDTSRPTLAASVLAKTVSIRRIALAPERSRRTSVTSPNTTQEEGVLSKFRVKDAPRDFAARFAISPVRKVSPQQLRREKEAEEAREKEMQVHRKSARAAGLLIAVVKEKCRDDGDCTKPEFQVAMHELGMIDDKDEDTSELFDSIDQDLSGIINVTELEATLHQLLDPMAHSYLDELLAEGKTLSSCVMDMREKLTKQASRVIDLFKKWDNNGDGQISRAEFVKAMPMLGMQDCLPIEINALFSAFDPDGSGEISFRELNRMLRRDESMNVKKEKKVVQEVKIPIVDVMAVRKQIKAELDQMELTNEISYEIFEASESELQAKSRRKNADPEEEDEPIPLTDREKALRPPQSDSPKKETSMWKSRRSREG